MKNEEEEKSNRRRKTCLNIEEEGFHAAGRMNLFKELYRISERKLPPHPNALRVN